LIRDNTFL